ncbi:MAG: ChaN family lipoprotein [Neomegalonema sp.]|nr:ChaN family lipoprotein [Neomegalonema sp.]
MAQAEHTWPQDVEITDPDGAGLTPEDLLERLEQAQVVVIGEIHDNPAHHAVQAALVAALDRSVGVSGIVFEMIAENDEAQVNAHRESGAPDAALVSLVDWSGWPDFSLYAPIFEAAPQARIYGGAIPRQELRSMVRKPADIGTLPIAARYGLDQPLSEEEQAAREAGQIEAHCNAIPPHVAPLLVAMQRLRDAKLADAALRSVDDADGNGITVVITGSGHADKSRAAPFMIATARPSVTVFSLGAAERAAGASKDQGIASAAFDAIAFAPSVDRPDPCAALKTR